jgi:hypothetical protein
MAMASTLVVVPRMPREVAPRGQIRVQRRLAAVLGRLLSELAALPDHGATLDDLPREFFRFPPF